MVGFNYLPLNVIAFRLETPVILLLFNDITNQ